MRNYTDTREKHMISRGRPAWFDWLLIMIIDVVAAAAGVINF